MNIAVINIIVLLYYIDTLEVTIRFADETFSTSDVNNPLFPLAEEIKYKAVRRSNSLAIYPIVHGISKVRFLTLSQKIN